MMTIFVHVQMRIFKNFFSTFFLSVLLCLDLNIPLSLESICLSVRHTKQNVTDTILTNRLQPMCPCAYFQVEYYLKPLHFRACPNGNALRYHQNSVIHFAGSAYLPQRVFISASPFASSKRAAAIKLPIRFKSESDCGSSGSFETNVNIVLAMHNCCALANSGSAIILTTFNSIQPIRPFGRHFSVSCRHTC